MAPSSGTKSPRKRASELSSDPPEYDEGEYNRDAPLKNYRPSGLLVIAHILCTVFLAMVLFSAPSETTAIVINGQEMVGFFKRCTGTQCSDWMQIESKSSGSAGGSAAVSGDTGGTGIGSGSGLLRRQLGGSTAGEASSGGTGAASSGGGGSVDYAALASPTGTAVLVAFWMSLYCMAFILIRWPNKVAEPRLPKPISDDIEMMEQGEVKDNEADGAKKDDRSRWERFKLFGYRAGQALQMTNAFLLPCSWLAVAVFVYNTKNALGLGGLEGVGGGAYLLSMAAGLVVYSAALEFSSIDGRIQRWLALDCCFRHIPWCAVKRDQAMKHVENGKAYGKEAVRVKHRKYAEEIDWRKRRKNGAAARPESRIQLGRKDESRKVQERVELAKAQKRQEELRDDMKRRQDANKSKQRAGKTLMNGIKTARPVARPTARRGDPV